MRRAMTAFCLLVVATTACGGAAEVTPSPAARSTTRDASRGCPDGPCIRITAPTSGATLRGGRVRVETTIANVDEAHIVFYRLESDDAHVPTNPDGTALSGGDGTFTSYPSDSTTYEWVGTPGPHVPPGHYRFAVQLVTPDHEPLDPAQIAEVDVNVQQ